MIDVLSSLEDFGDGEEPWCDLLFEITEAKSGWLSSKTNLVHAAMWKDRTVAFSSVIDSKDWEFHPAQDEESVSVWWGGVKLSGAGKFGQSLCELWRDYFKIDGKNEFVDSILCQAVALQGDPTKLKDGAVRMKLFFDNGNPEEYAELFYNLDVSAGYAALNEKDPEYREPLVKWVSGEVGNA